MQQRQQMANPNPAHKWKSGESGNPSGSSTEDHSNRRTAQKLWDEHGWPWVLQILKQKRSKHFRWVIEKLWDKAVANAKQDYQVEGLENIMISLVKKSAIDDNI